MAEGYTALEVGGGEAFVREGSLPPLRRVDAVVFDCDGVLIDIGESYNRAISRTVAYLYECFTGNVLHERLISDEVIFLFRRSGGFNNDWDTADGALALMLSDLPREARARLEGVLEAALRRPGVYERLNSLTEERGLGRVGLDEEKIRGSVRRLKEFAALLDVTGVDFDRKLAASAQDPRGEGFHRLVRGLLNPEGGVGEGVVATVFEELFCGPELFKETYGVEARLHRGRGFVERGRPIILPETLEGLQVLLGQPNLGVASGSRLKPAAHILGGLLERFNPAALVFADEVEKAEVERYSGGARVRLRKPHPYSLLRAAEAFKGFRCLLYAGDSAEDALMVREARRVDDRFLFAGVYGHTRPRRAALRGLLGLGCDLILPTVNELPSALAAVGRGRA